MKSTRRTITLAAVLLALAVILSWQSIASFILAVYFNQDYTAKYYIQQEGSYFRKDNTSGETYPVIREFKEDFEGAASLPDLIGLARGWTGFTLQSPLAPTVEDYNQLRNLIMAGESGFLDNRLEPSPEEVHAGLQSLKALAVPPSSRAPIVKASLHSSLMYFAKGDHVWISAWVYLPESPGFMTLIDLETTFIRHHPGIRLRLNQGTLDVELAKWIPKITYKQEAAASVPFPTRQWVEIRIHWYLSEREDGLIQVWQDGALIIDTHGKTLPVASAVYDDLEIGISAYSQGEHPLTLYMDDLIVSTQPQP